MKVYLGIFISFLLWAATPLMADDQPAFDYDNNIGFMKDVPKELREAFPMCDEFLDVKWIREMPNGSWVGKTLVDMYEYDQRNQRELISLARGDKFHMLDVSTSDYKDKELEDLIKSAEAVLGSYNDYDHIGLPGLLVKKNDKEILVSKRPGRPSPTTRRHGLPRLSFTHFTKNVCLTSPRGKEAFVVESEKLFISTSESLAAKESKELFDRLVEKQCQSLTEELDVDSKKAALTCSNFTSRIRRFSLIDADGDGRMDWRFIFDNLGFGIAFLNDAEPFLMMWPENCHHNPYYYVRGGKQQEEQCVGRGKKKYLDNMRSE